MNDALSIPPATLERLIDTGDSAWQEFRHREAGRFHRFIPSDHWGAYEHLKELRTRADNFVELGCGVGIVTIMASLLHYDAYGIEIEAQLVERAREIARGFGSRATFQEGTFVPVVYEDDVRHLSGDFLTLTAGEHAFDEIGMDLEDFDLIFAYPWPGEEDWLDELIRRFARPGATLLSYHSDGGFQVKQVD